MLRRLLVLALFAVPVPALAQGAEPVIELVSLAGDTTRVSAADWARLSRETVPADAGGGSHPAIRGEYAGVPLRALLTLAGAPEGPAVRGDALRIYVLAQATDGYRAIFTLAELDPGFTDARVIVADRRDGAPLDEHQGPLRIIAPGEKRPGRWVRNLARLSIHQVP